MRSILEEIKNIAKETKFLIQGTKMYRKVKWRNELRILGGNDISASDHQSIIHFTFHRCASQWVKSVLRRVAKSEGMIHVRWNEMAFNSDYPFLGHLDSVKEYDHIFYPRGYLYSAYQGDFPIGIPNLGEFKIVFMVRDPRDILVSKFFSIRQSHRPPPKTTSKRESFDKKKDKAMSMSIDEFVLSKSDSLLKQFNIYGNRLVTRYPNTFITRYEDMVNDVEAWLERLLSYIELSPSDSLRADIVKEAREIQKKDEDPSEHTRKGEVGDHREKLRPSTIDTLNEKFSHILDKYDYAC